LLWTVRSGQSFGSIADATGINLSTLEALNPRLHLAPLQPGDQVRLRPGTERPAATEMAVTHLEASFPGGPLRLIIEQRLNVWGRPPSPRRKPSEPLFWMVGSGQSFGSIADSTGISLSTLEALNPGLRPATLQPGDRVALRRRASSSPAA